MNCFLMSKKLYNKRTVDEEYLQGYIEVDTDRKLVLKTPRLFWDTFAIFRTIWNSGRPASSG